MEWDPLSNNPFHEGIPGKELHLWNVLTMIIFCLCLAIAAMALAVRAGPCSLNVEHEVVICVILQHSNLHDVKEPSTIGCGVYFGGSKVKEE